MDKFAKVIGGLMLGIGSIMLLVIFGTLCGGIAGWIVGLFFSETILGILSQLGVHNVTMWQFGSFMGFVGGFMKTKVSAEVKSQPKE